MSMTQPAVKITDNNLETLHKSITDDVKSSPYLVNRYTLRAMSIQLSFVMQSCLDLEGIANDTALINKHKEIHHNTFGGPDDRPGMRVSLFRNCIKQCRKQLEAFVHCYSADHQQFESNLSNFITAFKSQIPSSLQAGDGLETNFFIHASYGDKLIKKTKDLRTLDEKLEEIEGSGPFASEFLSPLNKPIDQEDSLLVKNFVKMLSDKSDHYQVNEHLNKYNLDVKVGYKPIRSEEDLTFVSQCIWFVQQIVRSKLERAILSLYDLLLYLDNLADDAQTIATILRLFTGVLDFNRVGRIRFLRLMNDVLALTNGHNPGVSVDQFNLYRRMGISSFHPLGPKFRIVPESTMRTKSTLDEEIKFLKSVCKHDDTFDDVDQKARILVSLMTNDLQQRGQFKETFEKHFTLLTNQGDLFPCKVYLIQSHDNGSIKVRDYYKFQQDNVSKDKRIKLEFIINTKDTRDMCFDKFYVVNCYDLAVLTFDNPLTLHTLRAFYPLTQKDEQNFECNDLERALLNQYFLSVISSFNQAGIVIDRSWINDINAVHSYDRYHAEWYSLKYICIDNRQLEEYLWQRERLNDEIKQVRAQFSMVQQAETYLKMFEFQTPNNQNYLHAMLKRYLLRFAAMEFAQMKLTNAKISYIDLKKQVLSRGHNLFSPRLKRYRQFDEQRNGYNSISSQTQMNTYDRYQSNLLQSSLSVLRSKRVEPGQQQKEVVLNKNDQKINDNRQSSESVGVMSDDSATTQYQKKKAMLEASQKQEELPINLAINLPEESKKDSGNQSISQQKILEVNQQTDQTQKHPYLSQVDNITFQKGTQQLAIMNNKGQQPPFSMPTILDKSNNPSGFFGQSGSNPDPQNVQTTTNMSNVKPLFSNDKNGQDTGNTDSLLSYFEPNQSETTQQVESNTNLNRQPNQLTQSNLIPMQTSTNQQSPSTQRLHQQQLTSSGLVKKQAKAAEVPDIEMVNVIEGSTQQKLQDALNNVSIKKELILTESEDSIQIINTGKLGKRFNQLPSESEKSSTDKFTGQPSNLGSTSGTGPQQLQSQFQSPQQKQSDTKSQQINTPDSMVYTDWSKFVQGCTGTIEFWLTAESNIPVEVCSNEFDQFGSKMLTQWGLDPHILKPNSKQFVLLCHMPSFKHNALKLTLQQQQKIIVEEQEQLIKACKTVIAKNQSATQAQQQAERGGSNQQQQRNSGSNQTNAQGTTPTGNQAKGGQKGGKGNGGRGGRQQNN